MTTKEKIVDQEKEAFVMAIEIYNKSFIKYRLEGISFGIKEVESKHESY